MRLNTLQNLIVQKFLSALQPATNRVNQSLSSSSLRNRERSVVFLLLFTFYSRPKKAIVDTQYFCKVSECGDDREAPILKLSDVFTETVCCFVAKFCSVRSLYNMVYWPVVQTLEG